MKMSSKKGDYYFQKHSVRTKLLKYLHCRQVLILICTLVVLECMCVMAELMVDLHGIRVRFDNEEDEIHHLIEFMKSHNVSGVSEFRGKSLPEVLHALKNTIVTLNDHYLQRTRPCECNCDTETRTNSDTTSTTKRLQRSVQASGLFNSPSFFLKEQPSDLQIESKIMQLSHYKKLSRHKRYVLLKHSSGYKMDTGHFKRYTYKSISPNKSIGVPIVNRTFTKNDSPKPVHSHIQHSDSWSVLDRRKRNIESSEPSVTNLFVFSVNFLDTSFFIVSHLSNISSTNFDPDAVQPNAKYTEHYMYIQEISHTIKYIGFCILSLMLCETLLKIGCLGTSILKKKIEVFDAFIVIASFALDVVFIDNKWYDTGKDATTILVLLLPWRVVRIVNSFMMTLNHKHMIEMMTVRRTKKKIEIKLRKLEQLMVEVRKDVELLISLCKLKGATESEIDACIYSKGRGAATLSAITSFASLMFISTLGKDPCKEPRDINDRYSDLVREVLEDEGESESEKEDCEMIQAKEEAVIPKNIYFVSRSFSTNSKSPKTPEKQEKNEKPRKTKRRATLPRRHESVDDGQGSVYYINDGYETGEENSSKLYTKRESRSMPAIGQSRRTGNVVTFEMTTQVTYL